MKETEFFQLDLLSQGQVSEECGVYERCHYSERFQVEENGSFHLDLLSKGQVTDDVFMNAATTLKDFKWKKRDSSTWIY